jgi:hypothetical protein
VEARRFPTEDQNVVMKDEQWQALLKELGE